MRLPQRLRLVRASIALTAATMLAMAACSDDRTAASLTGIRSTANFEGSLDAQITAMIPALYPPTLATNHSARWAGIKRKVEHNDPRLAQALIDFVAVIQKSAPKIIPPEGTSREQAAAHLVLLMSLYVHEGPSTEPPSLGAGSDATLAIVLPSEARIIQTPSRHAGISFPEGAVSLPTIVVITKNDAGFPECAGPLPTTNCQYPGFYKLDVFPDVKLSSVATVAVCRAGGTPPDADRLRIAHQKPTDAAAYHPQGTIDGDIEILPLAAGGSLVDCEHPLAGTVFMFSDFGPIDLPSLDFDPAQLAFLAIPTITAGQTIQPISVEIQDVRGARVAGATDEVTLVLIPCRSSETEICEPGSDDESRNTLSGVREVEAVAGVASFEGLSTTVAGDFLLVARTARGLMAVENLTVSAGPPAALRITLGNDQTATAGTTLPILPTVALVDAFGNTASLASPINVSFVIPFGGGSVPNPQVVANGQATITPGPWTLNSNPGMNSLIVTADGIAGSVAFTATGTAPTFNSTNITAGWDFTCAVSSELPYCWGDNTFLQLGDGTTTPRSRPTQLAGELLPMTQISGGMRFACGLATNGAAYCWGFNASGQLGIDALDVGHATPMAVVGGHTFTQISVGANHACALDGDGIAWCWGDGAIGQLGVGVDRTGHTHPLRVAAMVPVVETPVFFTQIDVGGSTSCGVATSGDIWCWGSGSGGLLGISVEAFSFVPVRATTGRAYTQVSVGISNACGLSAGSVYCWGSNTVGQLGIGPEPTGSSEALPALGVLGTTRHVAVGEGHTCAVTAAAELYCWGRNNMGQLGDGTTTQRSTAVRVVTDLLFTQVTAGLEHSCAVRTNGAMYCWGSNGSGRLGTGAASGPRTSPVPVATPFAAPPPPPPPPPGQD